MTPIVRTTIRMELELKEKIDAAAREEKLSANQYMVSKLTRTLPKKKGGTR